MRKTILTLLAMAVLTPGFAQNWTATLDSIVTFSSPRPADLNGDGVDDVVLGSGVELKNKVSVVALDGKTGKQLWNVRADDELFGSAVFQDVNNDNTPDVFIGGRSATFYALDGTDGSVLWEFFPHNKTHAKDSGWYNFYHPQWIADQDNDGLKDLLVVNSGDPSKSYSDTIGRPAGNLLVLSAKTGRILVNASAPDKREMYMSPLVYDLNGDGSQTVVFGTGGETYSGGLYTIGLNAFINQKSLKNAKRRLFTVGRGFVPPPCIADLDADSTLDLVVQGYNGTIYALSGNDFSQLWKVENPGHETQCTPAIGNFTGSHHPDVFAVLYKGKTPSFKGYRQLLIDGKTGKVAFKDSLSDLHFASPAAFDYNGDGRDEAVCSYNFLRNGQWNHEIHLLDFAQNKTHKIVTNETGSNLASTPLIQDLDGNGKLDMVYAYRLDTFSPQANSGIAVKRLFDIADVPVTGVAWGSYLGTQWNGVYHYTGKECSAGPRVSAYVENPSCNGGSNGKITLNVAGNTGPYLYTWSNDEASKDLTGLKKGIYNVRVVDQNGCHTFRTYTVKDPFTISHSSYGDICKGDNLGYASVSSSGCKCANSGCTFKWNTGEEDHTITELEPGTYWVKITHANGCVVYDTVDVAEAPPVYDSFTVDPIKCFGDRNGAIKIYPHDSAGFKTTWSTGDQNVFELEKLKPDSYAVVMQSPFYCYDTLSIHLKAPDSLHFTIADYEHVTCHGAANGSLSLKGIGGTPAYNYWVNGQNHSAGEIHDLDTGYYRITVRDSFGCTTYTDSIKLLQPEPIELSFGAMAESKIFREDGSAWVQVSGGVPPYTYLWDDDNEQTNDTAGNLKSAKYKVVVTDAKDCQAEGEVEVPIAVGVASPSSALAFGVYPNPSTTQFTIQSPSTAHYTITSATGKVVQQGRLAKQTTIEAQTWPRGLYFVEIDNGASKEVHKLVLK